MKEKTKEEKKRNILMITALVGGVLESPRISVANEISANRKCGKCRASSPTACSKVENASAPTAFSKKVRGRNGHEVKETKMVCGVLKFHRGLAQPALGSW